LTDTFIFVNEEISNDSSWDSYLSGTTAVISVIVDNLLHVGHVGDSQLFVLSQLDDNWSIRKETTY
jgi:serine/threonine protein phosphatase PrpC